MKVLLTATVQSHIVQFHKPLVEVLHAHGCEVHVAARDNLAEKNGLKLDFVDKVYNVPFDRSPKSTDNIKAYKQLKKIIDEGQYDIVHCNTPMGGIVTRLAARKARKNGTKVFYTAHGFHFYKGAPKKNWIVFYPIEKFFSRMTDKVLTITEEDYLLAKNRFMCPVFRIHGVGANSTKFSQISGNEIEHLKQEHGLADRKIILNVGELLPNKNQKAAINAMSIVAKAIPEAMLLIAGNGKEKETIQSLIQKLCLENNVQLIGYTTELQKYLNTADLLVACSYREGLGMNLLEAMLCGKAIVASKNRGHRELIRDGHNGYLVEANDYADYADKMIELLQDDRLRAEMGERGKEMVSRYTDNSVKHELRQIYGF